MGSSFFANVSSMRQISGRPASWARGIWICRCIQGPSLGQTSPSSSRARVRDRKNVALRPTTTHPLTTQLRPLQTACWFSYLHLMQNIAPFPNVPSQEGKSHRAECCPWRCTPRRRGRPAIDWTRSRKRRLLRLYLCTPEAELSLKKDPRDPGRRAVPAKVGIPSRHRSTAC
jgi:hypothetical protein